MMCRVTKSVQTVGAGIARPPKFHEIRGTRHRLFPTRASNLPCAV